MRPEQKRRERAPRRICVFTLTLATMSAFVLALIWSERQEIASAQDDAGISCGTPATGWSNATVNDFSGTLAEVSRERDTMGAATAAAATRLVATLAFANASDDVVSLGAGTTVALVTCDGHILSPNAGAAVDPASLTMEPGAELEIQLTFIVPAGSEPERIVVRIEPEGRCFGQLGFPLAVQVDDSATPAAPADGATPEPAIFASCDGGSADAGASTSGTDGSDGTGGPSATNGNDGTGGDGATAVASPP